jgi:hypothetical protein
MTAELVQIAKTAPIAGIVLIITRLAMTRPPVLWGSMSP